MFSGQNKIAFASVVTAEALAGFDLLWASLEIFHGSGHHWFVRCDSPSKAVLSRYPGVRCAVFDHAMHAQRVLDVLADARNGGEYDGVLILFPEVVVSAPVLHTEPMLTAE